MVTITFVETSGIEHEIEATAGENLMELATGNGRARNRWRLRRKLCLCDVPPICP